MAPFPRTRLLVLIAAFLSLAATMPAGAAAATYYVGGTGASDANPGTTEAKPWATMNKAITAPDGSLVLVKAGEYPAITASAGIQHRTAPVTIQRADYAVGDDPQTLAAERKVTIGLPTVSGLGRMSNLIGVTFKGLHFNGTQIVSGADGLNVVDSEIGPTYSFGFNFQKGTLGAHAIKNSSFTGNWFHDSNQAQKAAGIQRTGGHHVRHGRHGWAGQHRHQLG